MKQILVTGDGMEIRMNADNVAHFLVKTKDGNIQFLIGVSGPNAEAQVEKVVEYLQKV